MLPELTLKRKTKENCWTGEHRSAVVLHNGAQTCRALKETIEKFINMPLTVLRHNEE
jgi:hypothetical protein